MPLVAGVVGPVARGVAVAPAVAVPRGLLMLVLEPTEDAADTLPELDGTVLPLELGVRSGVAVPGLEGEEGGLRSDEATDEVADVDDAADVRETSAGREVGLEVGRDKDDGTSRFSGERFRVGGTMPDLEAVAGVRADDDGRGRLTGPLLGVSSTA